MSSDLSHLSRIKPSYGKAQWVEGKCTGIDETMAVRTATIGVPYLMPGTIVFVHGVNSEGEWYRDAAEQFVSGLKQRLGRSDLELGGYDKTRKRFTFMNSAGERARCPILPFYWGSSVPPADRRLLDTRPDICTDAYGNPLRSDGTWGGGPFQNGTTSLTQFWSKQGFDKNVLNGTIDAAFWNPLIGRELRSCPNRLYYVHAARRLAHLVQTIREDFPGEPINLVAHSQGTMIALCALFYIEQAGVRGPDTVLLNSSPYRLTVGSLDSMSASEGSAEVQSEAARVNTFKKAAEIVAKAGSGYVQAPLPDAPCEHQPEHRHRYDDKAFVQRSDSAPNWQEDIGGRIDTQRGGRKRWSELPMHRREDNRGRLFVNFDPADRVIGVSAVEGIGWRGIPSRMLSEGNAALGENVMQRIFARTSNDAHNPAVGARTQYRQPYFYKEAVSPGGGQGDVWHYLDGGPASNFWKIPGERMALVVPALGRPQYQEHVYINAPLVPKPAVLANDFDGVPIRYDGLGQAAAASTAEIEADEEQQEDFKEDVRYTRRGTVMSYRPNGMPDIVRLETDAEVETRRRNEVGYKVISPTNHAAILRYTGRLTGVSTVRQVLSYDLTVGRGYAFGDEAYWNYLLDLADWKRSDPYYRSGVLTVEKADLSTAPNGIDTQMMKMPGAASTAYVKDSSA